MDGKGFQVWLSAARGLTARAAARGARGAVGPERGRCIEGRDRAWCGRGPALSALRDRRGGFARYGAGSAALPVQGLRQDLQRAERYAADRACTTRNAGCRSGVAGEGGDGEGLGGALRRGGEHGVPLASPVSGGGAERFGGAQGDRGSGRDLRPGEPEGRARAGTQGTAAGRQGEEARPLARAGTGSHGGGPDSGTTVSAVLPRVDAAALTAALDPVVAKDALLVSDGGASYPPCAAALGVSHEALNRSMGERVRGDLHVQTVNSRHSRLKDFLRPRRGIATPLSGQLPELVPPRRPRPRRQ